MKRILFLSILLIFSIISYSKPTAIDSLKQRVQTLESISNRSLQKNDSLTKANISLNNDINYNEKLLDKYDKLNNTTFTIIGILFAFFGVIVPVLGYFFVVQPSKEKVKEAEKLLEDTRHNMDKLFAEYITKNRDTLIDNALLNIETDNTSQVSNSFNYLDSIRHEGFNDKQILRIIKFIKNKHEDSYTFMQLLCNTESVFTTEFLHEFLKNNPLNKLCVWSAIYAAKYNKEEFLDDIAEYIIQSKELTGTCASINSESYKYLNKVYNNEKLAMGIDSESLINHMSYHDKHNERESSKAKRERQDTKLYKRYLEVIQ